MKIDSGHSGYYYPNRTPEVDRKPEESRQQDVPTTERFASALTGSSTFLSHSLANALWSMETGETASTPARTPLQQPAQVQDWVKEIYQEFAEA